ncbi:MAG TPA: glycosyltransferase [Bacteroidales bacterium]|nr:glycosyltransferase [Bacteroidales bacterium]
MDKIVVYGPGPRFKGGIANYNTSLAKALDKLDVAEIYIISWTQQYPAIIPRDFIDRSSKSDLLEGTKIKVNYITNYNNPFSWNKTVKLIREINPKMVIFQWAIAIQGLPMGYIAKKLKKIKGLEVVFDLHFVIQKEGSKIDKIFTRMGIRHADSYVVHAYKTFDELKKLFPAVGFKLIDPGNRTEGMGKRVVKLFHPVYDMFKPDPDFDVEEEKRRLGLKKNVFLFFGFIRKYKGLHDVIRAFAKIAGQRDDVSLLIVGESFWQTLDTTKLSTRVKNAMFSAAKSVFLRKQDDERNYRPLDLIGELDLKDKVTVVNAFVPNEDVHRYFQVSDAIMLYYLTATPSGVESIGYNFRMPILATRVGHFPETVKDGYNGYLAEPGDLDSMAEVMVKAIEQPISRENVSETSREMSWLNYAKAILNER